MDFCLIHVLKLINVSLKFLLVIQGFQVFLSINMIDVMQKKSFGH